jgi:hypothetical protein
MVHQEGAEKPRRKKCLNMLGPTVRSQNRHARTPQVSQAEGDLVKQREPQHSNIQNSRASIVNSLRRSKMLGGKERIGLWSGSKHTQEKPASMFTVHQYKHPKFALNASESTTMFAWWPEATQSSGRCRQREEPTSRLRQEPVHVSTPSGVTSS